MRCWVGLLIMIVGSYCSLAQSNSLQIIPQQYATSKDSPLSFRNGDRILIKCPVVYVINEPRYELYRKLQEDALVDSAGMIYRAIISQKEETIQGLTQSFDQLSNNCKTADEAAKKTIGELKAGLDKVNINLIQAEEKLNNAESNLTKLKEELKQHRKASLKSKVMIGAGGTAIGLILGIIWGK